MIPPARLAAYKVTLGKVTDLSRDCDPDLWAAECRHTGAPPIR